MLFSRKKMPIGAMLVSAVAVACSASPSGGSRQPAGPRPDEPPVMVNTEAPFHYPASLYARKLQGNVTLRLFIDVNGAAVPDSTRVDETSGYGAFDSAAVAGARELRFVPAKLRGEPMAMTILFPVYFRHPEVPALPGDSILRKRP
jgi:periplasmic protein TonB